MSGHGFPHHPAYGYPASHQHNGFLHAHVPPPGMPQHPLANMERMAHNIGEQGAPPQQIYPDAMLNPTQHYGFVPNIPMPNRAPNSFGYPGAPILPNPLHLPHGPGISAQGPSPENDPNLHQQLLERIAQLQAQLAKEKERTTKLNTKWLDQQQRQMREEEYWNHQIRLKQSEVEGWQLIAARYAKIDKATDCEGLPEPDPAPASQEGALEPDYPIPATQLDGPSPVTEPEDPTPATETHNPTPTAPQDTPKVPFDIDENLKIHEASMIPNFSEFKAKMMKSVSKVIKTEVMDDASYGVDPTKEAEERESSRTENGPSLSVLSASESSRSSEMPVPPAESVSLTEPEGSEISSPTESEGSEISSPTEAEGFQQAGLEFEERLNYDLDLSFSKSSAPIRTSPSPLDHRNVSPDAADSDDSLPPRLLSPEAEVLLPRARLPGRPSRRCPAYRLLRDAAKIWKPHAQDLPRDLKAFKEYFAIRQIYKKTMKIAPILDPGSLEYAKRVQEANARRRETLVSGDPACAFVSCLYDASQGPIPQLVTKPPQVWILYASFRRDTADDEKVPTKKEIAADWNRISEQQGDEFWEWKLRTTKLYDEHLVQMEKGYIWVQPDVRPRGRKRKVLLDGDERRNSKKARIQPEPLEEGSEESNDDDVDFMT
ncbi:hypothetical protein B9Z55_007382 [Caenorhabditis nigoni]|uniref:Uncharacterized protein n=1 Tax=Caenorhabditis nigoni TaxID=1611254 RepID=A0A2G5V9D7_9PELO|nr:hypothetical protein B9Z55_007382 [Caenorhabditis nigoni]